MQLLELEELLREQLRQPQLGERVQLEELELLEDSQPDW